jgi:hypothetical protein
MDLRAWLQDKYNPVVAVVSTPGAEAICIHRNGLNVVDVLRPFGTLQNLNGASLCSFTPVLRVLSAYIYVVSRHAWC